MTASTRLPIWLLPNVLVPLTVAARLCRGLAVWAIYIADRLLDTRDEARRPSTARHSFHSEHRTAMSWLLLIVGISASAVAAMEVRPIVFQAGAVVAAMVAVYLYAVHRGYLAGAKEMVVATLFAAGTLLSPLVRAESKPPVLIAGAAFFLACLANTVAIDTLESGRASFAPTAAACVSTAMLVAALLTNPEPGMRRALAAATVSTVALPALHQRRHRISPDAFRVLADTALLTPILAWPCA